MEIPISKAYKLEIFLEMIPFFLFQSDTNSEKHMFSYFVLTALHFWAFLNLQTPQKIHENNKFVTQLAIFRATWKLPFFVWFSATNHLQFVLRLNDLITTF